MVLLAALVWIGLNPRALGFLGLAVVGLQQLFSLVPRLVPSIAPLWEFIYPTGADALGGIQVLYVIVPWVGVMAVGYAFGALFAGVCADLFGLQGAISAVALITFLSGTIAAFRMTETLDSAPLPSY